MTALMLFWLARLYLTGGRTLVAAMVLTLGTPLALIAIPYEARATLAARLPIVRELPPEIRGAALTATTVVVVTAVALLVGALMSTLAPWITEAIDAPPQVN